MSAVRQQPSRFQPGLEHLEDRSLMSVTSVTLNAGVLRVTLDNGNDSVRIAESSPLQTVALNAAATTSLFATRGSVISLPTTLTVTDLTHPGAAWSFHRSLVQKIEVHNHNSYGDVNTIVSTSNVPTVVDLRSSKGTNHVETGGGNDTVWGSDGNDSIFTGAGNDMVAAGLGDDIIDSGIGSDTVMGGVGKDTIVDAFRSTDANLLYGEIGNDTILSFCKNDVVDGGADIDTVSVRAGAWIVRNVENITINNVPLGNAVTDTRLTARQSANRLLEAYGLPTITHGIILNDDHYGLKPSNLLSLVREQKPNAVLNSNASTFTIAAILKTGKPVIAQFAGREWVVVTGYDSASRMFTFVGKDGLQHTSPFAEGNRAIIY